MTSLHPKRFFAYSWALLLLSACSTQILKTPIRIPVYEGPLRSFDAVGIFLPSQIAQLSKVDGVYVKEFQRKEIPFGMAGWEIELLPGVHTLEFNYVLNNPNFTARSITPAVKTMTIEAGRIYLAHPGDAPKGRWDVNVVDVTTSQRAGLIERRSPTPSN